FARFMLPVIPALASLLVSEAPTSRKVMPLGRTVSVERGNSSDTCAIHYYSLDVRVTKYSDPNVGGSSLHRSVEAKTTKGENRRVKFDFHNDDTWTFVIGPDASGRETSEQELKERRVPWFADMYAFQYLLKPIARMQDGGSSCGSIADFIEETPQFIFKNKTRLSSIHLYLEKAWKLL
ncbi:hypothetical protein FOZ63_000785, partial [Perkinsus olseni]